MPFYENLGMLWRSPCPGGFFLAVYPSLPCREAESLPGSVYPMGPQLLSWDVPMLLRCHRCNVLANVTLSSLVHRSKLTSSRLLYLCTSIFTTSSRLTYLMCPRLYLSYNSFLVGLLPATLSEICFIVCLCLHKPRRQSIYHSTGMAHPRLLLDAVFSNVTP